MKKMSSPKLDSHTLAGSYTYLSLPVVGAAVRYSALGGSTVAMNTELLHVRLARAVLSENSTL
jgi:hypothetical protein